MSTVLTLIFLQLLVLIFLLHFPLNLFFSLLLLPVPIVTTYAILFLQPPQCNGFFIYHYRRFFP